MKNRVISAAFTSSRDEELKRLIMQLLRTASGPQAGN